MTTSKRNLIFSLIIFFAAGLPSVFFYQLNKIESNTIQYLNIWEEEIAKTITHGQSSELFTKIRSQINNFGALVQSYTINKNSYVTNSCAEDFEFPITLYGLPIGQISFCYNTAFAAKETLTSPFLLLLMLIASILYQLFKSKEQASLRANLAESNLRTQEEISQTARQVAHDIRSPLTALTTLAHISNELGDEKLELFRQAVHRIRTISDDLHEKGNQSMADGQCIAFNVVDQIASEKSHQHPMIKIHLYGFDQSISLPISEKILSRILSNLINNSIEAMSNRGTIIISLMRNQHQLILKITDEGPGIRPTIISEVFNEGATFGKQSGTGLGLSSARRWIKQVGGEIEIDSEVKKGTQIRLIFPIPQSQSQALSQETF